MPIRVIITKGTEADCKQAIPLINGIVAEALLADRAFDTNKILEYCEQNNIQVVIPPKKNRKELRDYDQYLYKLRHLVENAILKLKGWRGVATRYTKTTVAFFGAVIARCVVLWLHLF